MEKEPYAVNSSPDYVGGHGNYVDPATGQENKSGGIMEAGELYGDLDTAEELGYVTRGYVACAKKTYRE